MLFIVLKFQTYCLALSHSPIFPKKPPTRIILPGNILRCSKAQVVHNKTNKEASISIFSDYKEYNTDTKVSFKVTMAEEDLAAMEGQNLMKKFNLTSSINLSNMVSEHVFCHYLMVAFKEMHFVEYE
jgi:hypothetical protein